MCYRGIPMVVALATVVLLGGFSNAACADGPEGTVAPTSGEYMGHKWHIDEHHMMWWDGEPYIPYGGFGVAAGLFGGSDSPVRNDCGLDTSNLWIDFDPFMDDPEFTREDHKRRIREHLNAMGESGGTCIVQLYMATLQRPDGPRKGMRLDERDGGLNDARRLADPGVKEAILKCWEDYAPAIRHECVRGLALWNEINVQMHWPEEMSTEEYAEILGEYAREAKRIVGDLPVFFKVAGRWGRRNANEAVIAGAAAADGLGVDVWFRRPDDTRALETLERSLRALEAHQKKTTWFFVAEGGRESEEDLADEDEREDYWSAWPPFRSKAEAEGMLRAYTSKGAKGFIYCGPSCAPSSRYSESYQWVAELEPTIIDLMIHTKTPVHTREAAKAIAPTSGEYMGHRWHIDENHMLWWDNEPYVRYSTTGSPKLENLDKFIAMGFTQFHTSQPGAEGLGNDIMDRFTTAVTEKGCTYSASLNGLWPREEGDAHIPEEDKVHTMAYSLWEVDRPSGADQSFEMSFWRENPPKYAESDTTAYLIDFTHKQYTEISRHLQAISVEPAEPKVSDEEEYDPSDAGYRVSFAFEDVDVPASTDLRLLLVFKLSTIEVMDAFGWETFPALWRPGNIEYYRDNLERVAPVLAKRGLRMLSFWDHINTSEITLFGDDMYPDYTQDDVLVAAYRDWLRSKFDDIDTLNTALHTDYDSFSRVQWEVPPYPQILDEYFSHVEKGDDRGTTDEAFRTSLWAAIRPHFDELPSAARLKAVDAVQDEFRIWFYGQWFAKYAQMAKEIIGNVPVLITAGGLPGNAFEYTKVHQVALKAGVDGLVRNHYGHVIRPEDGPMYLDNINSYSGRATPGRDPVETIRQMLDTVQEECGKTKHWYANEIGWPHPGADDFGAGTKWSFESKEDMRDFMYIMADTGWKGFNLFTMFPEHPARMHEVEWFAELKPEIVKRVICAE